MTTYKKVLNNLQPGTYAIRVKAVGAGFIDSEWSAIFTVIVTGDTNPPPVPAAPTVEQSLAGINISWIDPSYDVPVDFSGVEVYSSSDSYTTPIGFITVKGGVQPFATQEYTTTYRFKFKAVDRSGNKSAFSAESAAISPKKLFESDVDSGVTFGEIPYKDNGNFINDGSFETSDRRSDLLTINTASKISFTTTGGGFIGDSFLNILSPGGLNQEIYLMGNPAATAFIDRYPISVNPFDVYLGRLAVRNTSGAAATVSLVMRVITTSGTTSNLTLITQSVPNSTSWQAITTNTAEASRTIPANAYAALIYVTSNRSISIDTTEVRQIIGTALIQDASINRAKIIDGEIINAKIASLEAGKITSGSISTAELQILSTGKLFAGNSASTGARLLFDKDGLRAFDSSNVNTVNISSNGSASFTGQVTATSGTFTGLLNAGNIKVGQDVNGTLDGIYNTATGDYLYSNGDIRLGNGVLTYIAPDGPLVINSNATFDGDISGASGTFTGNLSGSTITGGLIRSSISDNNRITINELSNTIRFYADNVFFDESSGTFLSATPGIISSGFSSSIGSLSIIAPQIGSQEAKILLRSFGGITSVDITSGPSVGSIFLTTSILDISAATTTISGSATFNSTMFAPNLTINSSGATLRVNTGPNGQILEDTGSSIRFKENIVNIIEISNIDPHNLLEIPVRAFKYKKNYLNSEDERYDTMIPGFIAEEVDEYYPIAVDHSENGPERWNSTYIIPGMLFLIQELYKEITELKTRLDALEQ